MDDTLARAKAQIAEMARDAFAQHECVPSHGGWWCHRPGTSMYGFWVFTPPGAVVFYGDLGEAILRPSDRDALAWLRGAVTSPDYLIEKVRTGDKTHFYPGDAIEWVKQEIQEGAHRAFALLDLKRVAEYGELDQHTWAEAVRHAGYDCDYCSIGTGPSAAMLWLVEALRWFVAAENKHGDEV